MIENVGIIDRALRILIGLLVMAWGLYTKNEWGALGVVAMVTGMFSWCPIYLPFRLNTSKRA